VAETSREIKTNPDFA